MKSSQTCPKCKGRRLLVLPEQHRIVTGGGEVFGQLDRWICGGCGFTEVYASDIEQAFDGRPLARGARVIQPPGEQGPYR